MELYNVQLRTDLDEVVVLQVYAGDPMEAEFTAKSMVECGQAGTISNVTKFLGVHQGYIRKSRYGISPYLPYPFSASLLLALAISFALGADVIA